MKIYKFLPVIILIVCVFLSCKRESDRIFEEIAIKRVEESVKNVYTVLQTNKEGWMMAFYPGKDQSFGGYTVFTRFVSNGQVSVASDVIDGIETSSYSVVPTAGPVLTFDGFNKSIHYFSQPGKDNGGIGPDDSGMGGDFEFTVLIASLDSVVLNGTKSGTKVVMLPIRDNKFDTIVSQYQQAAKSFSKFKAFKLEGIDGALRNVSYDYRRRVFRDPNDDTGSNLSFRVIPEGIDFYQTSSIDGVSINSLSYVQPTARYPDGYYAIEKDTFKLIPILNR